MDQSSPWNPVAEGSAVIAGRMRSFLAAGGRALVLAGAAAAGRSAVLETVLAGLPGRQVRIGNPSGGPLTMKRVLREMGLPRAEWSSGLFFRALAERAYDDVSAVIVVEDAQSLSPYALRALARVPGLGGPELPGMILVLAGDASLLGRLSAPGLDVLRNSRRALVLSLPEAGPSRPAVPAGVRDPVRVRAVPRRPARSWPFAWPAVAGGLAVAATMGLWSTRPLPPAAPAPTPPSPVTTVQPDVAAPVEVAPVEVVPVEVVPAPSHPLQPAEAAAKRSPDAAMTTMRRQFDAFLDRAGRDTAKLAPAARETLFREYLLWRVRGPGSP